LGILGGNDFAGGNPSVIAAKTADLPFVAVLVSVAVDLDTHLGAGHVQAAPAGL
jgi:hypothetical protein